MVKGQKSQGSNLNPASTDAWCLRAGPSVYLGFLKHQVRGEKGVTTCCVSYQISENSNINNCESISKK